MPALSCNVLDLDGIGRRGFILLAAPDHDSPEKGLSAPKTNILYFTAVTSKQSDQFARIAITYSYFCCGNNPFSGKGRQC